MVYKHTQRCSTSSWIRETEIKTPVRHGYSAMRMAKLKNLTTPSVAKDKTQAELANVLAGV